MAALPVILNGVMYPKNRAAGDQPMPAVFCGYLSVQGLEIGGGPIFPEDPGTPPIDPPIDPPDQPPPGNQVAVVVKPAPVTGGWGIATDTTGSQFQWFYTPGAMSPGPKR